MSENNLPEKIENKLPTIQELELSPDEAFKHDQFKLILNAEIPLNWIKKHPFAKKENPLTGKKEGIDYLPIDKVEFLLDRIFQEWKVEVVSYNQLFNSVSCHVRLHYLHPINGKWSYQDGLGSVAIQTDKGANASDLGAIKSSAVQMALPASKSYAIKDASEHLGRLFGRNLNRADTIDFKSSRSKSDNTIEKLQELYQLNSEKLSPEDDMNILRIIETKEQTSYKKAIKLLKTL